MQVLTVLSTGVSDPTKFSVSLHLAANGSLEVGDDVVLLFTGDATEYLVGDALDRSQGVGVPAVRELVAKLKAHSVPVFV